MKFDKYLKEEYGKRKVYSMFGKEISNARKVIEYIQKKLEGKDDGFLDSFYKKMEMMFDEDTADIVDSNFSADHLHYYQNGRNKPDTYEFIETADDIKKWADRVL